MAINKLTDKQERFCDEYIIDLNATQAAIRAGYSEKTAYSIAEQNLRKLDIQTRIKELQEKIQKRNELKADDVIQELRKIGFMDIGELYQENGNVKSVNQLSDKAKASISSIKVTEKVLKTAGDDSALVERTTEMKLWDKGKALVELGKHLGIFKEDNKQKGFNGEIPQIVFKVD